VVQTFQIIWREIMKNDIEIQVSALEQEVGMATGAERVRLHPKVKGIMDRLRAAGEDVPPRLRRLNATLDDEFYDDMFDNIPI